MHMKKYVVSILTLIMIFGLSADVLHNTEAAGNYKIGEIKYIANDCTNISCTDELVRPPLLPGSIESTKPGTQNFNKKIFEQAAIKELNLIKSIDKGTGAKQKVTLDDLYKEYTGLTTKQKKRIKARME